MLCQGEIHLTKNCAHTKHIDFGFNYLQGIMEDRYASLLIVHTNILSKVVTNGKFQHCLDLLNVCSC